MAAVLEERASLGGKVRRGLAWSACSSIVLRLGNLLVGVLMARLLAPEEFGQFAIALTVWLLLGTLAEFGLGANLIRRDDYEAHIPTVTTLSVVFASFLALLMAISAGWIAEAFGSADAASVVRVMSVSLVLAGLSVVPAALLQRSLRQRAQFGIDACALLMSTGVLVAMALDGYGPMALAVARIISQLATLILLHAAVHRLPHFGWDWSVVHGTLGFGGPLAAANLLSWVVLSVDNLVVGRSAGAAELGLYVLAFNLASWPMAVAGQSVRVVALPAFSRLESRMRAQALVTVSAPLWSIALLLGVGLAMLASELVSGVYGAEWTGAASALVPLALFGSLRVMFDLMATFLIAAGRTGLVCGVTVVWLLTLVPALVWGVHVGGIAGAGWAQVLVAVTVVLPAYLLALQRTQVPSWQLLRCWLLPTTAVVPVLVVLWLLTDRVANAGVALVAGGLAGVLLYALPLLPWWLRRLRTLRPGDKIPVSP